MSEYDSQNNADAIITAVQEMHGHDSIDLGCDQNAILMPKGMKIESIKHLIDEYRVRPERREGVATMQSVESFIEYVNRFKNGHTVVFASEADPDSGRASSLHAIIDHHEAGADGQACFGRHQCKYDFPMSDEWRAWSKVDGDSMDQETFAELLEDRIFDVRSPYGEDVGESADRFANELGIRLASPAELRDLGKGLAVRVGQQATQTHNVQTGESSLQFAEEHADSTGKPLTVPGGFVLGVPVFREGRVYQLCARLRYRVSGSIRWIVKLHRSDIIYRHAFGEACELVSTETGCAVFRGQAERALPAR